MESFKKIEEYGKTLCEQIRWKRAHEAVWPEIKNHILDQKNAFIAEGENEEEATDRALLEMGDAAIIGAGLDRAYRPKPQFAMIGLIALMVAMGIFIRLFAVYDDAMTHLPALHIAAVFIGFSAMLAAYLADFSLIGKHSAAFYIITVLTAAIASFFSGPISYSPVFISIYGARFLPLIFPLVLATVIFSMRGKGYGGMALCFCAALPPAIVALSLNFFSNIVLLGVSIFILMLGAVHKGWFGIKKSSGYIILFTTAFMAVMLFIAFIAQSGYYSSRLATALNPYSDPMGNGYTAVMTRQLINDSVLFGHDIVAEQYAASLFPLPNINTDYLLTYLIFNYGWISLILISAVLGIFIIKGFSLCFKQKSGLGFFVSLSIMVTFAFQAVIYLSTNLGFSLFSPISLPLISYGNTAMVINLFLIGIMLSVFRTGDIVKDSRIFFEKRRFISLKDGKIIIDFNKGSQAS